MLNVFSESGRYVSSSHVASVNSALKTLCIRACISKYIHICLGI